MRYIIILMLIFLASCCTAQDYLLDDDVVAMWHYGVGVDTSAYGDGHSAVDSWTDMANSIVLTQTSVNRPWWYSDHIHFDGDYNQWMTNTADIADFRPGTGDFTVEWEVKSSDVWSAYTGTVFSIYEQTDAYADTLIHAYYTYNEGIGIIGKIGDAQVICVDSTADDITPDDNEYYVISISCDRDDSTRIYVNGVKVSASVSDGGIYDFNMGDNVYIGGTRAGANNLSAEVKWIRYSLVARSSDEVLALYQSALDGFPSLTRRYIDPDKGSDSNSGLSPEHPLASFDSLNTAGITLNALDTVCLREGTITRATFTMPRDSVAVFPYDSATGAILNTTASKPIVSGAELADGLIATSGNEETGGIFVSGIEDEVDAFTTDFTGKSTDGSNTVLTQQAEKKSGEDGAETDFDGSSEDAYFYKTLSDLTDDYYRIYFKLNSDYAHAGSYQSTMLFSLWDATTCVLQLSIVNDATAGYQTFKYKMDVNGASKTTIYNGSYGEVTLNTWHYAEIRWVAGTGADGGGQLWVDGASKGSNFTLDQTAYAIDQMRIGNTSGMYGASNNPVAASDVYYDDIKVDTSPIGASSLSATNTWYLVGITTEPTLVTFRDTLGTDTGDKSTVDSEKEWAWDSDTLWVNTEDTTNIQYAQRATVISLNHVTDITLSNLVLEMALNTGTGKIVNMNGSDNSTIQNSTLRFSSIFAVWVWEGEGKTDGISIINNTFDESIYGIWMSGDNWTITGNTFSNMNVAIQMTDTDNQMCDGFLISGNTFSNLGVTDATPGYGILLEGDTNGDNADYHSGIIKQNSFSNVAGRAIDGFYGASTVAYNKVSGVTSDGAGGGIGIEVNGPNNKIYNNVIYNVVNIALMFNDDPIDPNIASECKNNILFSSTVNHIIWVSDLGGSVDPVLSNNIYWQGSGGESTYYWESADYNFTTWVGLTSEANSFEVDPLFVTNGTDFRLQATSPAIDNGVDVGLTEDYVGNGISGDAWDIGAYEYQISQVVSTISFIRYLGRIFSRTFIRTF